MHKRLRIILGLILIALFLLGNAAVPGLKARASTSTQNVLPLGGYQIYFSEDHREASRFDRTDSGLSRLGGMLQGLGAELYTLEWRAPIPANADLVVIAGPMWNLSSLKIARLWVYLNDGGTLLMLADVSANPDFTGIPSESGIFQLLWDEAGLNGANDLVIKDMGLQQPNADTTENDEDPISPQAAFPLFDAIYFTTTNIDSTHPITAGLTGELAFFAARSLEISGTSVPYQVTPLVFSDTDYYGETTLPVDLENAEEFQPVYELETDIPPGALPLAAAVENIETEARIVIVGDGEFATNGMGLQTQTPYSFTYVYPANAQFLLNSITWLLDTDPVDLSIAMPDTSAPVTETATTK